MKNIIERLKKGFRVQELTETRLQLARFRKLLENTRAIMNLVEDGREKFREEYIFDRHYVTSLVDRVIERAGMLVFDAVVLAPEGGEALYRLHDRLKAFAVEHFLREEKQCPPDGKMPSGLKPIPEEPELQMLSSALDWITGPLPDGKPSIMDFIRLVFDHVIPSLRDGRDRDIAKKRLEWNRGDTNHVIHVVDLEEGQVKEGLVSAYDVECRPLGMMIAGADGESLQMEEGNTRDIRNWIAFTGRDRLSLRGTDVGNRLYLEATLSGHTDADFIFLFAEDPLDPKDFLPKAFHMEKTALGAMAWNYDLPGQDLGYSLSHLGARLLGGL
jgi:hypothetical protein